ncbi:MAG: methyltransferase domain-containing protein [Methanoregula sp.]|uniref:class I SAM-dependent methyltransferase n=1 Tax=Methanoregula sp. TaxID=2052170 RepID=UPI003BB0C23B
MVDINFDSKASVYEQKALVQKSASDVLLGLMSIREDENVLDLGCGSGRTTREIARCTEGIVVGTDISGSMINEAISKNAGQPNVSFLVKDAECLGISNSFDVIYCNSAFQWFSHPKKVLKQCFAALKPNGRMGIQAPATAMYCPNFVSAIEQVCNNPATRKTFGFFKNPWMFLEREDDYRTLFEKSGFDVEKCTIVEESARYTVDQVYGIYQSGAENGYLNQSFYSVPLTDEYVETFRSLMKTAFKEQADEYGMVNLTFNRIYLVAKKSQKT